MSDRASEAERVTGENLFYGKHQVIIFILFFHSVGISKISRMILIPTTEF